MSVSLCMIVKNEEDNLAVCLNSVKDIVDEIILVDTGSTDRTREVAERFGAKIYDFPWNNSFSDARNYSLSKASGTWMLIMDADDELEAKDKDKLSALVDSAPETVDVYCCRTICFTGDDPDCCGAMININVRLIRNGRGYRFSGRIHEQLEHGEELRYPLSSADICFRHYGYLNAQMESKQKHQRNIALIKKELEENPNSAFMQFNLGNEYLSLNEPEKALLRYRSSYLSFNPELGYSPTLLTRMILCCEKLGRRSEAMRIIRQGLRVFPSLTDFEFLRANEYHRLGQYGRAVWGYKKCIRMGPPPIDSASIPGVGTFQPQLSLAALYRSLGDNGRALRYCRDAIRSCPDSRTAYEEAAELLFRKGYSARSVKKRLIKLAGPDAKRLLMLSDLFYDRRYWRQALSLATEAKKTEPENPAAWYDEGVCRLYLGQHRAAAPCLSRAESLNFRTDRAAFLRLFCRAFSGRKKADPSAAGKIRPEYAEVFERYLSLAAGKSCAPLSRGAEYPQSYIGPIFDLLETLLRARRLKEFQFAAGLLNLIRDDGAPLRLGKLYYRNGFMRMAYTELTRSIKLCGRIDAEGLAMMGNALKALQKNPN